MKYFKNRDICDITIVSDRRSWSRPLLGRRTQANAETADRDHHLTREQNPMSTMSFNLTAIFRSIVPRWTQLKQTVAEWRRRVRSRFELANLDESDLQDSGISRSMAEFETSKPFWIA